MKRILISIAIAALPLAVWAQAEVLQPNANLKADGIPPIARSLADGVGRYSELRGHSFAGWHPTQREMLVSYRADGSNVVQLFRLGAPGATLERLTDFPEPIRGGSFDPASARFIVYTRDTGGNEASRVYRLDLETRASTLLSEPDTASGYRWNRAGTQLLIASVPLDRTAAGGRRESVATTVALVDPLKPTQRRVVAELPGTGWTGFEFTSDDRAVVFTRYVRSTLTEVWKLDLETGARVRLLPTTPIEAAYESLEIAPDGQRLFLATSERSEFTQLAEYRFDTGALRILSEHIPWDAESLALSYDGQRLAAVFNVDGRDELRLFDASTGRELERPRLPGGRVSGLRWHRSKTAELGLTLNSSTSPAEIVSLDTASGSLQKWTTALVEGVDPAKFREPEIVRWRSFDGRMISGLLTLPPAQFAGPRPVLISIHGGPESQARVGFRGRSNYFTNEAGIALIEPNVRGSGGYGKTFLDLDNGVRREDAVRDIGALLDWIATDPRLDAKRVMVVGGSYGGYMVLASLVHFSDRLRGGIDVVGISDFVTFLANTESYRRDLRRTEYGDEREPAVRAVLDKISPLANADRIRAPLFVVHGRNDPRVPYTEAEQIVAKVRGNAIPVWYLLADNEGHGFARKANADFQFYAMVAFIERFLLGD